MATRSKRKSNEVREWLSRIAVAEKFRDDEAQAKGYDRALLEYKGDYESVLKTRMAKVPIVPINEVFAFVKSLIPGTLTQNPHIATSPRGQEHIASSIILEKAANYLWKELGIKREVKRAFIDGCLGPFGVCKVGYSAVFGTDEPEDGKQQAVVNEYIKQEEIFVVRETYKNLAIDPDSINVPHDTRWIAHRQVLPFQAVKDSTIYINTEKLEPNFMAARDDNDPAKKRDQKHEQNPEPWSILWEVWDRDRNQVFTLSEGHDQYLIEPGTWPYDMEGYPFAFFVPNDIPDELYPMNLISPWEPQLWEKIKIRSMELDHVKRFNRQLFSERGALKTSEMNKFQEGSTGSVIQYEKGRNVPVPVPYPPIQPDIYAIENRIDNDKDNISGQNNVVRGASQKTQSRTLGELDSLLLGSEGRTTEIKDSVDTFQEDIAKKMIQLMKQFKDSESFVPITGMSAQEIQAAVAQSLTGNTSLRVDPTGIWYTKEDIQAEVDVSIQAGSSIPLSKENRIKLLTQILRFGPSIGIEQGGKVAQTIGLSIARDFDMAEVERALQEQIASSDERAKVEQVIQQAQAKSQALEDEGKTIEIRSKKIENAARIQEILQGGKNGSR